MEDDKKPTEYLFHDEFKVEWLCKMLCFVALNAELYGRLLLSCFSRVSILCNPVDGSPPGSPVPGILQARTLGWVAISFSNA